MKIDKTSHSTNKISLIDEYYTPRVMVESIIEYIKPKSLIWCPFDTEKSEFVKVLKEQGHTIVFTHIWNKETEDFFKIPNQVIKDFKFDYIISNPPFSRKKEVFTKLFEIGIPFAVIMGHQIVNYGTINQLFDKYNYQPEIITYNKRPTFDGNPSAFMSVFYCKDFLPKGTYWVMKHFPTSKEFIKSEMYEEEKYLEIKRKENNENN